MGNNQCCGIAKKENESNQSNKKLHSECFDQVFDTNPTERVPILSFSDSLKYCEGHFDDDDHHLNFYDSNKQTHESNGFENIIVTPATPSKKIQLIRDSEKYFGSIKTSSSKGSLRHKTKGFKRKNTTSRLVLDKDKRIIISPSYTSQIKPWRVERLRSSYHPKGRFARPALRPQKSISGPKNYQPLLSLPKDTPSSSDQASISSPSICGTNLHH
ncbi:unnamed protein product [Moneuplotes crassus]|uniref:Uncharacterized protein n=1 Tax=Euplotes crassus TaxID=5936 RepID=A0AAD1UEQ2_EUPCR|nr:unnamed protein product [Moneuplotes crassus]